MCTKDVLKIFDVSNDPQIRDNNPICGNDEGVPILMSLTVIHLTAFIYLCILVILLDHSIIV